MRTIIVCLALCATVADAAAALDLIADPHFERGLTVKDRSGAERVIQWRESNAAPVWITGQHFSKSCFADSSHYAVTADGFSYKDDYQSLAITPAGNVAPDRPAGPAGLKASHAGLPIGRNTGEADFIAGVNAKNEFGGVYREKGDPWPHLYLCQRISNPGGHLGDRSPRIAEMARLDFEASVRLLYDRKNQGEGYNPQLHAAQFCFFFTVQNLEPKSRGYGDYYWFGLCLYDSRREVTSLFAMRDKSSEKKKGTEKLIYDIGIQPFTREAVGAGNWVTVRGDLLPHIVAGLQECWKRGFLPDSKDLADYRIGSLVVGWEITGLNDDAMAVRGLQAAAVLKE